MKTLVVVFAALLTLSGCVDQKSSEVIFTMINETDKSVTVLSFDTKNAATDEIYDVPIEGNPIQMEPNSSHSVTRHSGLDDTVSHAFYSRRSIDSVRVIFGDEKVKIYTLQGVGASPDASIFFGEGSDGDYRHTITEEDYNTAQDCDPDCESTE